MLKKIFLSGLVIVGLTVQAVAEEQFFFSSVPELNKLEKAKIGNLCWLFTDVLGDRLSEENCVERQEFDEKRLKVQQRYSEFYDIYLHDALDALGALQLIDNNGNNCSKVLREIIQHIDHQVQHDPELAVFAKKVAAVCCKWVPSLYDDVLFTILSDDILEETEIMSLCATYVPRDLDVIQVVMEHSVIAYNHLQKQLKAHGALTADDICYTCEQLAVTARLPKNGHAFIHELSQAAKQGVLHDLPVGIRTQWIKNVEEIIRKPELEMFAKLVSGLIKMRKEIIQNNGSKKEQLMNYEKMLDMIINQIEKIVQQPVVKKQESLGLSGIIIEKLLFA